MQRTLRIILTLTMTKYRKIDFEVIKTCWENNIYVVPEPIKTNDKRKMARIDVCGFDGDGMIILKRKGKQLFDQTIEKEKEKMNNLIMDAYEYYYETLKK